MENYTYWHGRKYRNEVVDNMRKNGFDRIDKERLQEISHKGGIASGKSRRKKAEMRKVARETMDNYFISEGIIEQDLEDFRKWQKLKRE